MNRNNISQCARPCCDKSAAEKCSACLKDFYCSGECQKLDWKKHKSFCKILKSLSNTFEPYSKVVEIIQLPLRAPENLRVLKHVLTYAEFQFGERIPNQTYRERESGERMDNWTVELDAMILIYMKFVNIYERNGSLSLIFKDNNTLPYYKKQLKILKPWSLCLNLDTVSQRDSK
jgi:hypothetical protein